MARKKTTKAANTTDLAEPQNRTEEFLANIAGLVNTLPEGEFSRLERYLKYIAENGGGGGGGGVTSFNSRTGAVVPQSADYAGFYAPSGYGLGTDDLPLATDCDTVKTGWYKTTRADTAHRADSSAGDGVLLSSLCDTEAGLNGFQIEKESTLLWFRICNNGAWGDWCSMNQYFRSGSPWTSEIRTMNFFGASPIYTKSLGLGNIPATGTTTVPHGIANLDQVLSIQGKLGATPIITAPGVVSIVVDSTNVTIVTSGATAGVGIAILEYTKSA